MLRGGRGSLKSWGISDALLIRGWERPTRWLCAREFQSSIRESVHQLLEEQIERLGLSAAYRVEKQGIFGRHHATEFTFTGLSDETSESIKSYEGYDGAWVEEARVLTQTSLNKLLPTIREEASEIWFSYNPELETDAIHVFADSLTPEDGIVIDLNWRDNPWFNGTIEAERLRAQRTLPKLDYENIWEGRIRPTVEGAIYADEVAEMYAERRVGLFPYDPNLLVYPVFDIGWNDKMSIGMYQRVASQMRKVNYLDKKKTYAWYSQQLAKLDYNWGTLFLPHDGGHGNVQTGKTGQEVLQELGWEVKVLPKIDPKEGIRAARLQLKTLFVNLPEKIAKQDVEDGAFHGDAHLDGVHEALPSVENPKTTREPAGPLHDEFSHGADEWRYAAQAAPMMDNNAYEQLPRRRRLLGNGGSDE